MGDRMGKTLCAFRQLDLFLQQQRNKTVVIFTNSEEVKKTIQRKYGDRVRVEVTKVEEPTSYQQFAKNDDFYRRRCLVMTDDMMNIDNPDFLLFQPFHSPFYSFYKSGDEPLKNHPPEKAGAGR